MTDLTALTAPIRARLEAYRMYGVNIAYVPPAAYKLLAALDGVLALCAQSEDLCLTNGYEVDDAIVPVPWLRAAVVAALGEGK